MTYPLKSPYNKVTTPYGKRGSYWSCNEDSSGNGVHTGCDLAAPNGTEIYAPIAGQIRHRSYGSSFGTHQFAISPDSGQPFAEGEVFFAHTQTRLKDGANVEIGDFIAEVGDEGNVSGPHLHMEYHADTKDSWNCSVHDDPKPILNYQVMTTGTVYLSKLHYGQEDSDSVSLLQNVLNGHTLSGGEDLPITGNYYDQTDEEVRLCQEQHGFGSDAVNESSVGPKQAEHLFAGTGNTVVNDLDNNSGDGSPPTGGTEPEDTKTFPLGIEYHYSGKPSGTFSFGSSKKKLDVSAWAPKKDGLTLGMLYANVDGEGEFRTSLVRDPDDASAYQTHYAKSGDNYLLTHVWFESGEGGRKLWYQFESMDGTTHTVTTRYAKFVTIPWDVVVVLEQAMTAYTAVSRPVGRFLNWVLEK